MVIINHLSTVDIPTLATLERSEFGTSGLAKKDFMSFFHKKNMLCVSAYFNSKTSGYLLATVQRGRVWINRVVVDPAQRRNKIGSSLLTWLRSWAGQRAVYMVLDDNFHAEFLSHQDFLRYNGFKLVSVVRNDNSPAAFYYRMGT